MPYLPRSSTLALLLLSIAAGASSESTEGCQHGKQFCSGVHDETSLLQQTSLLTLGSNRSKNDFSTELPVAQELGGVPCQGPDCKISLLGDSAGSSWFGRRRRRRSHSSRRRRWHHIFYRRRRSHSSRRR